MLKLTLRERTVRTNRTAQTTKYLSALRVSSKIFSIALLTRKLPLKAATRSIMIKKILSNSTEFNLIKAEQDGNTLSCMGDEGHKSIVIHICSIISLALFHAETEHLVQDLSICYLHRQ